MVAACGQFRTRDCRKITTFLSCSTQPIIEATSSIKFACFQAFYNDLESHFEQADLSIYNNNWWNVHDFTPISDSKNWSLLGECYKIPDFFNWPSKNEQLQEIGLNFQQSVVPLTIGDRIRDSNSATLVLIFKHELQLERSARMIEEMRANKAEQIELVKTRQISFDFSDAERLFGSEIIRQNVSKGPLIALQVKILILIKMYSKSPKNGII